MNRALYIPGKTRAELSAPAPEGRRHEQMKKVIISLIGNGLSADAVFAQVRGMYSATVTDREIIGLIQWASRQGFTPCAPQLQYRLANRKLLRKSAAIIDPGLAIDKFLAGGHTNETDLRDASPWRPLEDWRVDPIMFVAGMFHAGELVNIVTKFYIDDKAKANPVGWGLTLERDAMMRHFCDKGIPQGKAGAWIRLNPIDGIKANAKNKNGTPSNGWTDANITAFRFILLEIDDAPLDLQLSFFAKLPLPINAILLSGGKSAHSIIRVNAPNANTYRRTVAEMLTLLARFGVDQANKNPSRLCRLPGAQRKIGAPGDGKQRLLYLAPDRTDSQPIFRE